MSEPIFEWMSPNEQRTRFRQNRGNVEKLPRPCDVKFTLTEAEQAEVDALPLHRRMTRYRELRAARVKTR